LPDCARGVGQEQGSKLGKLDGVADLLQTQRWPSFSERASRPSRFIQSACPQRYALEIEKKKRFNTCLSSASHPRGLMGGGTTLNVGEGGYCYDSRLENINNDPMGERGNLDNPPPHTNGPSNPKLPNYADCTHHHHPPGTCIQRSKSNRHRRLYVQGAHL